MEKLIESNPGLSIRIGFTVEFDDYTREQLCEIFELMAKRAGLRLEDGVIEAVRDEVSKGGRRDDQGNARFVRRLYEDVLGAQQMRLSKIANEEGIEALVKDDLRTIKASDVVSRCAWKQDASDAKSASATLASRERLERLIGLADVKRAVLDRLSYARVQKIRHDLGMSSEFIPIRYSHYWAILVRVKPRWRDWLLRLPERRGRAVGGRSVRVQSKGFDFLHRGGDFGQGIQLVQACARLGDFH